MSRITVDIRKGDITRVKTAAIVNASNTTGAMAEGVSLAIRRAGGQAIEDAAIAEAPIPVGMAVATTAGSLPFRYVVHAVSMKRPRQRIPPENIAEATRAAIETADRLGCESLAIPDLGVRMGKVSPTEAARAMLDAIAATKTATLRHVVLIDVDKRLYEAWRKARHGDDEGNEHPHGGPGERRMPRTQAPARRRNRHRSAGYGR
ncbi:MAG TPA: macro domain-containing protein [Planctomycetota bacterium]|nr:macro domain-containing protein [Planctomycetota bacterium]